MKPDDLLTAHFRLNPLQKAGLVRLRLSTLADLLRYLPARYGGEATLKHIAEATEDELVSVSGKVIQTSISKTYRSKMPISEIVLEDQTGKIRATWFHQAYMAKKVPEGSFARVTGKVAVRNGECYFANPDIEQVGSLEITQETSLFGTGDLAVAPVYPERRGVSSLWIRHAIQKLLKAKVHEEIADPIPSDVLARYHLAPLKSALVWIHTPRKEADALAARKRFAFEDVFLIQLARQQSKREYRANETFVVKPTQKSIADFLARFPFTPTAGQKLAIKEIASDLASGEPMTRLLEGDVGSGKTAVAATAAYAVIITPPTDNRYGHLQVAYMAPTEILAKQHFESFCDYFAHTGISVGLLTGSGCRKFPSKVVSTESTPVSRTQLLKWAASGEISILIGTHALIQKSVKFKNLALTIVDEQHRFGVRQRAKLVQRKEKEDGRRKKEEEIPNTSDKLQSDSSAPVPHLLSMTATPIPRTLALTIYGDLDLTLLDEMPAGRKPIITTIVLPAKREELYAKIRARLQEGRQLYVICPRIHEPDPANELALIAKSAVAEAARLKRDVFPERTIAVVHSKMTPKEKDAVMASFAEGGVDILVATSVVEVGVNVPNATMIIIEGAERFGLAQLHQIRGRVLRSNHQAYCYLFTESRSEKTLKRLKAIMEAKSGFELAERDLELRGAGELDGGRQWGISDIGMEAIRNLKMVEAARTAASELLDNDPDLLKYPVLLQHSLDKTATAHFE